MFSKPIFKQCLRSNGKLWLIFTFVCCLIMVLFMWSYDASAFSTMAGAAEGTKFESMASSMTSFLGSLESFYKMVCILLGMVYVIITSSNLIVSEVDSGSMAYTLSTPIQRSKVVMTKMLFMILSVILMFLILTGVGIGAAELTQHVVLDDPITEDVEAAASAMNRSESYVRDNLYAIQDDEYALKSGAEARNMDVESYTLYLDMKMLDNSYKKAAEELTEEREDLYEDSDDDDIDDDFIEITKDELAEDPSLMMDSTEALKAGAAVMGMSPTEYKSYINDIIAGNESEPVEEPADNQDNENPEEGQPEEETAVTEEVMTDEGEPIEENPAADVNEGLQDLDAETILSLAMSAAAKELGTDTGTLGENMVWMKDNAAMEAEMAVTGQSRETLENLINTSLASGALAADGSVEFDLETFAWLNIGCCLLILAFSAIGFFASCIFNRSKYAMVLGGGLPFVFYILTIVAEISDNLENIKYLTITTLFNTEEILKLGDFGVGLAVLAGIAAVLYAAGSVIFCKKDLPL
ncbi:MAG: ABC transporter permease subunit [Lachnospiraceae bacterium]